MHLSFNIRKGWLVLSLALSVLACKAPSVTVTSVSVSPAAVELKRGETIRLSATVLPDNATDKTVEWSSSNAAVASVAPDGTVSAVKVGEAIVSATAKEGGKRGDCTVTVAEPEVDYIIQRTKVVSETVTNGVRLSYNGTVFNRIYMLLPKPVSNLYQDISHFDAPGCTQASCPDGVNQYIWKDITSSADIPASGSDVISETFDATVYKVTVNFSLMGDIPPYDPESEECKKYLGKEEGDLIDPTNSKIVSTANALWDRAGGDIIGFARMCHEWTFANMTYGNMNTGLHSITSLMKTMTGDCGNYSSVFISLLRAKGIPARHVVMVHAQKDEFHVRAEFFLPSYGWIPADPTWGNEYFGVFEGNYIVVTQGINTLLRDYSGNDFRADLFQTFCNWYWYSTEGSNISFTHHCTVLR